MSMTLAQPSMARYVVCSILSVYSCLVECSQLPTCCAVVHIWMPPLHNLLSYSQKCQGMPFPPTCQTCLLLHRPH